MYDEKQNTVTITVVCCSPEKIKEKIVCKAGDTVKSIEIVPEKKKEPEKKVTFIEPPKESAKPPAPAPAPAPAPQPDPTPTPIPSLLLPVLVPVVLGCLQPPPLCPVPIYPSGVCSCCYKGGPCNHGRGPICYDGCGRPANECSSGNRSYYVSRCDEYFSEENAWGCSVM